MPTTWRRRSCRRSHNWSAAVGESFHVVSPQALTLRGYAETMGAWFGQPAVLEFQPWEEWRTTVSAEEAQATWDHIAHSPNCSIAKAQRLLDYQPRYTSLQGGAGGGDLADRAGNRAVPQRCWAARKAISTKP